ncbi:MAG: hypothetical protein EAZ95_05420 [Bacteroidetes bacterium]|nr:MAG: hypothetical protein EAZ95_05420 [Bacteroidota bacterium]
MSIAQVGKFCVYQQKSVLLLIFHISLMAYNKFKKLEQLQKDFGINHLSRTWISTTLPPFQASTLLLQNLEEAVNEPMFTEKARSEYVIAPIIKELKRQNPHKMSSFSGYEFDVDKSQNLNGFCDFILTTVPNKLDITSPIFCLVEAKKDSIEKGWGQCGAEMYAAQIFNEREGTPQKAIYGCVSTGFLWCFLKLVGKELWIEPNLVPLTFQNPQDVLAVLQWILDESVVCNTL